MLVSRNSLAILVVVATSGCATGDSVAPVEAHALGPAKVENEANITSKPTIIVRPRGAAIEHINRDCNSKYEIINERPADKATSATVGVGAAVSGKKITEPHVVIEYRCR